ncbi:pyocin knob domain-containing protein [Rahnella rivi]|uniref:pyocin knob domain-containing protein n=1 Tax=Rahnella rivi TaxID=2816249 RepID=UPI001EE53152|nr:pyocin knob domain-containing protein [Rahnella rivi]
MATEQYVNDLLAAHEKSRNHPDGTTAAKGFVQLSSSVSSTSEALAATPKAVKTANDNANTRVPSTRKINGKALSADQTLTAADVGALPVASAVLGTTNINTLNLAKIGVYVQSTGANATVANGYPAGSQAAGVLEVIPASWTGGVLQRYTVQNTGLVWTRALNASWNGSDGPWRNWEQVSAVNSVNVPTAILTATDINTLGFASGNSGTAIYSQPKNVNATAALHYPQTIAGTLYVTPSAYGCQQMYVTFTGNIWNRGLSADWNGADGPWKEWVPTYSANNKPTAADVGAWTAAQSAASEKALSDEIATAFKIRTNLTATDTPNTLRGSSMFGHYGVPGAAAATTEKGYPINNFVGVIFVTWGPNATQQIAFNNNGRQFTRSMTGAWNGVDGPWSAWNEIYCQANKPTFADVGALPAGGTAVAASKLDTARKIAGVAFDGTKDISISAANVGALSSGGTAVAATKLATARKIAGVAFDGTKDINLTNSNVGLGNVGNFAAVQQGGGAGMQSNKVYIGWTGSKVKIQVDASDMGEVYTTNFPPPQQDLSGYAHRDWITYVGLEADNPNAPYMRRASNNALVYLATSAWSDSRFIYDVQRGSQALENAGWTAQQNWEAPTGCFMTGLNIRSDMGDCRMMGKYYRALMIRTASGSWRQVGN